MQSLNEDYVEWIGEGWRGNLIEIRCDNRISRIELKKIGAKRSVFNPKIMKIKYKSEKELADILSKIRDIGIPFIGGPAGWPPSSIFEHLREKGMIDGNYINITWKNPNETIKFER